MICTLILLISWVRVRKIMQKVNIRYLKTGTEIGINKRPIIKYYWFSYVSSLEFSFTDELLNLWFFYLLIVYKLLWRKFLLIYRQSSLKQYLLLILIRTIVSRLKMVNARGFEPLTYCLEGSCSIQLSYASTK